MNRITKKFIHLIVEELQKQNCDIAVNFVLGQGARFTNLDESIEVSDRMSIKDAAIWLNGFKTAKFRLPDVKQPIKKYAVINYGICPIRNQKIDEGLFYIETEEKALDFYNVMAQNFPKHYHEVINTDTGQLLEVCAPTK